MSATSRAAQRTLSFLRIMFFPMASTSAFSPSERSSGSSSSSESESESESLPRSYSAGASRNPALSAPRLARDALIPVGSFPSSPAPPSSSLESESSSYVSSTATPRRFAFFAAAAFAAVFAAAFASFSSSRIRFSFAAARSAS